MSDGGVSFFDPKPVQRAEVVVSQASSGLRELMPAQLLERTLGLERWQWLALPVVLVLVVALTLLAAKVTEVVASRVARRTKTQTDDQLVVALRNPFRVLWFSLLGRIALPLVSLPDAVEGGVQRLLRIGLGLAFFWALVRAVNVWTESFSGSEWANARPGARALVSLAARVSTLALIALAVLATLSELGYSVTSVLAGLGLGGLALALGAQKTLENVFGAFALAVDQPFREGDQVKVEDVVGTVETIGLRSTRIRTYERTLVTIPNGKLADLRLESFAPRDRLRLQQTLALEFSTTATQLKAVRDGIAAALEAEPGVVKGTVAVRFVKIAESSLELDVSAYFQLGDLDAFRAQREKLLLTFLENIERAGTRLAYPTRSVQLSTGTAEVRLPTK
jgi:MscS family membrane protein